MKTTLKCFVAAACLGFGGLFSVAAPVAAPLPSLIQTCPSGLSWELAMDILEVAWPHFNDQTGISFAELADRYADGTCTIKEVPEGYEVDCGGGMGTVVVVDSF